MVISVHQPQYIPWLGYLDKISRCDAFVYLDCVQYKAREFQNRNKIRTDKGELWLTVPVVSKGKGRQMISEVLIDNDTDWRRQHNLSLKSYYAHSAYFKDHEAFFDGLYSREWEKLSKLNVVIIEYLLEQLGIRTPVYFESELGISSLKTDRIIDICLALKADAYLSGAGGKDYLEEDKFFASGIKLEYQHFIHPVYRQQYMKSDADFMPYMSGLDLLFNEGPKSMEILDHNR